jgi:hypothetical protein
MTLFAKLGYHKIHSYLTESRRSPKLLIKFEIEFERVDKALAAYGFQNG